MKHKILFLLLTAISMSFATWDIFPVPEGSGGNVRLRNQINYGEAGNLYLVSVGDPGITGKHTIDFRYYTHRFEFSSQLWGYQWVNDGCLYGAQDLAISLRYQLASHLNFFVDLDGIPWGRSNANSRHFKFGTQIGGEVSKHIALGLEFGFKEFFKKDLEEEVYVTEDKFKDYANCEDCRGVYIYTIDAGDLFNISAEIDIALNKTIFFVNLDLEIQDGNTVYNSNNYREEELGSGDKFFQICFGLSKFISNRFSIEESNFFRFGQPRTTSMANEVDLKWSF